MMRKGLALAIAALMLVGAAGAADAKEPKEAKPLFAADEPIKLTLKGPINDLARGSRAKDKTIQATLSVQGESLPVTLSARGITRRMAEVCPFPPIRVVFPDKPPSGSLFKGQKELKLVTHCRPAESFQQYVLLEYAAYRIYNQLTPLSFRARLATIDYVDAAGKPMTTRVGYFLEDIDDVAKRNGLKRVKVQGRIPVAQLSAPDAARFVLFEYMISNLDWAMTAGPAGTNCCHNSRPVAPEGATANFAPVPYDFDFSGMVDAPYATPPEGIKVANVRVRVYRGFCAHNDAVQAEAAALAPKRAALIGVLDTIPELSPGSRQKASDYLGGFFDQIGSPQGVAKLQSVCLKGPAA
jgi:hypothetical protein